MNDDLISRSVLNDIWELYKRYHRVGTNFHEFGVALKEIIDNAQPVVAENATSESSQGDVAYLCDGDNCPEEKASCKHGGPCRHTTNIEHAINFRRFHDTDNFFEVENVMRIEGQENQ